MTSRMATNEDDATGKVIGQAQPGDHQHRGGRRVKGRALLPGQERVHEPEQVPGLAHSTRSSGAVARGRYFGWKTRRSWSTRRLEDTSCSRRENQLVKTGETDPKRPPRPQCEPQDGHGLGPRAYEASDPKTALAKRALERGLHCVRMPL